MKCPSRLLLGILAWCAAACGAPGPREAQQCPHEAPAPFGVVGAPLELERWLEPAAHRISAPPHRDVVLVASGALAAGEHLDAVFSLPREDCALLMARGSVSATDLDLFAYADDGAVLGSDEATDATPAVLVCPPHPERFLVSARLAKGNGLIAVGAQRLRPAESAKARTALGLDDSPPRLGNGDARWPDLAERLTAHRELVGGEWEAPSRRVLPADSRLPTHVSVNVAKGRCADVLVLPDARVGHLDMAVLDLEGRVVGHALATGRERFVAVCSGRDTGFTLRLQPQSGHGTVALLLSRSLHEGATALDIPAIHLDPATTPSLDAQSRVLSQELEERGYPASPARRVVLHAKDVPGARSVELGPGCHRLDFLANLPVRSLEVNLWSADGTLLGTAQGSVPLELVTCTERVKARLDVRPEPMPGDVAVELRTLPRAPDALRRSPLAANRLLSRMLGRGVVRSIGQVTRVDPVELDATSLVKLPLTLPVGRCVDTTIALGPGSARGVELTLRVEQTGAPLAFARGALSAAARVCTLERPEAFAVTVEARTLWGAGPALFASRLLAPNP